MSDTITVGNIHHSIATAIGDGATAVVHFINNPLHPDDRPKAAIHLPPLASAFTGRLSLIQNIADGFVSGNGYSMVVTQAISGLGGVGKTQAALAYAHLYRPAYDIIWLLSADNSAALDDSLRQLGLTLELPLLGLDAAAIRGKVLSRLSQSGERALLIYDNADTIPPHDLRPYLPSGCHALITSRRNASHWSPIAKPLTLGAFTPDEAMSFWGERMVQDIEREEDWSALGEALDYLPLAMEQAAAFMLSRMVDAAAYLRYFNESREALWKRENAPNDYHATVATTWEMAFEHARQTMGAAELFNLCCFFAPDEIPLAVMVDGTEHLPVSLATVMADEFKREDALAALEDYSLLTVADGKANMHRLAQDVARWQMGDDGRIWVEVVLDLLAKAYHFDKYDTSTWMSSGELIPHLTAAVQAADALDVENRCAANLNSDVGVYHHKYGMYAVAVLFFKRALTINEKVLDPDHPRLATSLNSLGEVLQAMGRYDEARPYLDRVLAIDEKALSPTIPIQQQISTIWVRY